MDDTSATNREVAVTIAVLDNDSDPDGDTLMVTAVGTPGDGTATTNGTTVRYTPRLGFLGTDTFTYTIGDPAGASDTAKVTVTVTEMNRAPTAFDDDVEGTGMTTTFNVITGAGTFNGTGNADFDPDGDPLVIDAFFVTLSGGAGTVNCNAQGDCTWRHDIGCSPISGSTQYTLRDGRGGMDTAGIFLSEVQAC